MTSDLDLYAQQDEREVALLQMEERMREVELTLRNLKLLLQEKVSQLKEQVQKCTNVHFTLSKSTYHYNLSVLSAFVVDQEQRIGCVDQRPVRGERSAAQSPGEDRTASESSRKKELPPGGENFQPQQDRP